MATDTEKTNILVDELKVDTIDEMSVDKSDNTNVIGNVVDVAENDDSCVAESEVASSNDDAQQQVEDTFQAETEMKNDSGSPAIKNNQDLEIIDGDSLEEAQVLYFIKLLLLSMGEIC